MKKVIKIYQDQEQYLDEIDRLIKEGKGELAAEHIRKHYQVKFNSAGRARFGSLARRLGQFEFALRLLNPIVRPSSRVKAVATPQERAEYAASLSNLGAVSEALELLNSLDAQTIPEILLFESHALFSQWNYAATIPLLFQYVSIPQLTEHQRLVGKANLAAALVYERDSRASEVLNDLIHQAKAAGIAHTVGYAERLDGERAFYEKNWKEAKSRFEKAVTTYEKSASLELLFAKKWLAFIELYTNGNHQRLEEVRTMAKAKRHWETLRNCDYHEAIATRNEKLLCHVYFGTPYAALRERLVKDYGKINLPAQYLWTTGPTAMGTAIDIFGNGQAALKPGHALYRLGVALSSDFYKPVRTATVFSQVYAGDFFNPNSSDNRVKQIVHRLRTWISSHKLPLEITSDDGGYRLQPIQKGALCIHRDQMMGESFDLQWAKLVQAFGSGGAFNIHQVVELLNVPLWTAKRMLKAAQEKGKLLRQGKARATLYTIPSQTSEKRSA